MISLVSRLQEFVARPFNSVWNRLLFAINGVSMTQMPRISGRVSLENRGSLKIGDGILITSSWRKNPVGLTERMVIRVSRDASLVIGKGVRISNSLIYAQQKIEIGSDAMIGGGCQIIDSNFHSLNATKRMQSPDPDVHTQPIRIGERAFIGTGVIILPGVEIGDEAVIGACSVVTKSVPKGQIWAGNPATYVSDAPR